MTYKRPEIFALNAAAQAVRSGMSDTDGGAKVSHFPESGGNPTDATGKDTNTGSTSSSSGAYEADE